MLHEKMNSVVSSCGIKEESWAERFKIKKEAAVWEEKKNMLH